MVKIILVQRLGHSHILQFEIHDTSIGIPADKKEVLFKPFHQVDSSITRRYSGSGLGLAIWQRLVDLMGGTIQVESNENSGSSFTFTISCEEENTKTQYAKMLLSGKAKKVTIVDKN